MGKRTHALGSPSPHPAKQPYGFGAHKKDPEVIVNEPKERAWHRKSQLRDERSPDESNTGPSLRWENSHLHSRQVQHKGSITGPEVKTAPLLDLSTV